MDDRNDRRAKLAKQNDLPPENVNSTQPDWVLLEKWHRQLGSTPFWNSGNVLPLRIEAGDKNSRNMIYHVLAVSFDPKDQEHHIPVVGEILSRINPHLKFVFALPDEIKRKFDEWIGELNRRDRQKVLKAETDSSTGTEDVIKALTDNGDNDSIVQQTVLTILTRAYLAGASDVHIEMQTMNVLQVRIRVNGVLRKLYDLPWSAAWRLHNCIKTLANLDIAERRNGESGGFRFVPSDETREVDVRVSFIPTSPAPSVPGFSCVMRLLNTGRVQLDFKDLGFGESARQQIEMHLSAPYGLILVTGPTGSGKSTTVATMVGYLNDPTIKILTAEDPIEYRVIGVIQSEVENKGGMDFHEHIREMLRQDPDVVVIGEVRDSKTAGVTIQAAMTGHLVISTLHTNNAAGSVARLLNLGEDAALLASSLRMVVAQRLVRRLCDKCKYEVTITGVEQRNFQARMASCGLPNFDEPVYRADGCEHCEMTGIVGRTAIHEIMEVDPFVRDLIETRGSAAAIQQAAIDHQGMVTIRDSALALMRQGIISPEDFLRQVLMV